MFFKIAHHFLLTALSALLLSGCSHFNTSHQGLYQQVITGDIDSVQSVINHAQNYVYQPKANKELQ